MPALDVSCNDNGVVISFDISNVPLVARLAEVISHGVLKSNCCISVAYNIYTLVPSELTEKSIIPAGQVNVVADVAVLISSGVDSAYCSIIFDVPFKTYISVPVGDSATDVTPEPALNVVLACIFPKLASESNVKERNVDPSVATINVSVSLI